MRNLKRILSVILTVIFISLIFSQSVEAASPESQIRKSVNGYIKACKSYNLKKAKSYIHMNKKTKFYYINDAEWNKYIKKAQKSFNAEITDISINGNTALVSLHYGGLDMYGCITTAWHNELHEKGKINTNRLNKYVINELKYALKNKDDSYFEDFTTIKLTKKKGSWKINGPSKNVIRLFDGGASEALKDISSNPFSFY